MALGTKKALAQSLRNLLKKRTLDKITVKDIVDDCGVNRQTFYYHFHDIYDLLEWIFQDMIETMVAERAQDGGWTEGMDALVRKMLEERQLILNSYHSVSHEAVSDFVRQWLKPLIAQVVEKEAEGKTVSAEDREFVTELFTLGTTGFLTDWVENQLSEEKLANLRKLKLALDGSVGLMLSRFDRSKNNE